jgi:hypothetical protein
VLTFLAGAEVDPGVLRDRLKESLVIGGLSFLLPELLVGPDRCPACLALAEAERAAAREVLAALPADPDDRALPTPTVCVPHVAAVLAADPRLERSRRLLRGLADALGRASEDMRTYSLKRESFRRRRLTDEELAAYLRAISYLAGDRELIRPWRRDEARHALVAHHIPESAGPTAGT